MSNCCEMGKPAPDAYVPLGSITSIGGTSVYLVRPQLAGSHFPAGLVLLLPDGFGLARHNFRLADGFSGQGWEVIVPDYFEGDGLPVQLLKKNPDLSIDDQPWSEDDKQQLRNLDFPSWHQRHSHAHVSVILANLLAEVEIRYAGVPKFGVGYCFGGKHVLRLGKKGLKAVAAFHPSFVEAGDIDGIKAPVYIGLAGSDTMVPVSLHNDLLEWKEAGMGDNWPLELQVYPGMPHGFAARPESEESDIWTQYSKAFQKAVDHFTQYSEVR